MLKSGVEAISEILGSDIPRAAIRSEDLFSSSLISMPKRHETYRLDPSDGLSVPSVIVPSSGEMDDFFATIATYYQDKSPISAVVHVLGRETLGLLSGPPKASSVRNADSNKLFRIASLGVSLGEATLAGLAAHEASGSLSYAACKRTLAFSLCRATVLYGKMLRADVLIRRWKRLRELTGLGVSSDATEAVLLAHEASSERIDMPSSAHMAPPLREALREVARGHDHKNEFLLSVLTDLYPETKRYIDDMRGAFDGRMTAFMRLVEAIHGNSRGVRTDEIAVAFVCNLILPGSFSHAGVLAKLVDIFPSALIWYGFLSALSKPTEPNQMAPGLIAKLERDLIEEFSFAQRPRCDIALEELEVLSRGPLRAEIIKPSQQRALLVALLPGVDVYTRFGLEVDASERAKRDSEVDILRGRVSKLLEEALYELKKGDRSKTTAVAPGGQRTRKGR